MRFAHAVPEPEHPAVDSRLPYQRVHGNVRFPLLLLHCEHKMWKILVVLLVNLNKV